MLPTVTFFFLLCLSVLLLFTLKRLKAWFTSIELLLAVMFASYLCQTVFYTLSSPYERLSVVEQHFPFWTVRLQYGVVLAITLMWVMACFRSRASLVHKLNCAFGWVLFVVLCEKALLMAGVLESQAASWYPSLDMTAYMLVVILMLSFTDWLRRILLKEGLMR
ncbi:hypothetical protein [Paenibacillus sp. PL2-23]|uniref:hypothetical protein n=1 Tax=Paenibacillus sp. PL2-23 TaxID=2100729 RepID=UPI0030F9DDD4